jgi:dCTP deaminase
MVLTDREIWTALQHKQIVIDPPPQPAPMTSTAVDLTLGRTVRLYQRETMTGVDHIVAPAKLGSNVNEFIKKNTKVKELDDTEGVVLQSQQFILAWTAEFVELPLTSRLAARVEGKSSLARLGIAVHVTAPTIHAGFAGIIQLEICNHGDWQVRLTPGMRVCQLIFEQTVGTPEAGYRGQFQRQGSS